MTSGETAATPAMREGDAERARLLRALAKLTEQLVAARLTLRHVAAQVAAEQEQRAVDERQVAVDERQVAVGQQRTAAAGAEHEAPAWSRAWSPPSRRSRWRFRALVELCHPDLAGSDDERARREALVRRAEQAYADDDGDLLEALTREWLAGRDAQVPPRHRDTRRRGAPGADALLSAIQVTLRARDEVRVATYRLLGVDRHGRG